LDQSWVTVEQAEQQSSAWRWGNGTLIMTKRRTSKLVFIFVAAVAGFSLHHHAYAASCDAILGKWTWFTKGVVTFNPDGTMRHESGNHGTWECTDPARGRITLRWRQGGYLNQVVVSADGNGLSSTDPSQQFVTAKRVGAAGTEQSVKNPARSPNAANVILTTQPDGARQLPNDLPELMHAARQRAQLWRVDAIPVSLKFEDRNAPNPKMRGPEITISFFSPAAGNGLLARVTSDGARTSEFNQPVNWGRLPLPPVFVDLPAAVRIARKNGMKDAVSRARLDIWSPSGAPPVLAWMIGDKTVNGATGEIIDYDVTGYIARYNAQWQHATKGLLALMRAARGGASSGGSSTIGGDSSYPGSGSDKPYDDGSAARQEYERRAAESRAYWNGSADDYNRVKNGQCTWSDSSKFGC
jgi:hypothetical protein